MRLARKLLHTPELAPYFDGDALPGPEAQSDDELLDYARQYGSTAYHLIGTARMGPATDRTAVVDDQLRVHGLQGLRVVDASIMPNMPSANTYCSTMMIAEKASDMIRDGRRWTRWKELPPDRLQWCRVGPTIVRDAIAEGSQGWPVSRVRNVTLPRATWKWR